MSSDHEICVEKDVDFEVELEGFRSAYSESSKNKKDYYFLGRKNLLKRLTDHLVNGHKGSYLIAGYRGVGKTRFVEEALKCAKEESARKKCEDSRNISERKYLLDVHINLGSDNKLDSRTVLFNIVSLLENNIEQKIQENQCLGYIHRFIIIKRLKILIISTLLLLVLFSNCPNINSSVTHNFTLFTLSLIAGFILSWSILSLFSAFFIRKYSLLKHYLEIQLLKSEIHASHEQNVKLGSNFFSYGYKTFNQHLDNNQIEDKLRKFLNNLSNEEIKVIFIFDELDKLIGGVANDNPENLDFSKEIKLRKKQIDSILGDLKNLVTASNAIFIFIAGRDMYDAYLSERGNANSLYESLFNDHIYIPSLLTDHSDEQVYLLDSMIESFLVSQLLTKELREKINPLTLEKYLELVNNDARINYLLKIFVHFLTLHSWGNYKRLITLFESFVVPKDTQKYYLTFKLSDIQRFILASNCEI